MEPRALVMLPGPTNVPDRVMNAMLHPIINHRSEPFRHLYVRLLAKAKQVFQTQGDLVILSSSGTGGVEAAVSNLVRPQDRVVVPVFGEFSGRLAELVRHHGAVVEAPSARLGDAPPLEALAAACEKLKTPTALFIVANETSTGVRFPWLREAGELAAKYGSLFIVDAISNLGGDDLPVDRWGIDVCITASQKCLAAPPGLALISVSERAKSWMREHSTPGHYFNIPRYLDYQPRGETPFTPALPLFHALDEALEIILEEGMSPRVGRHRHWAQALYSGLSGLGLDPFCREEVRSNTVLSIRYPSGIEDAKFRKLLAERFRVLIAGGFGELKGPTFRVGCMGEVSEYHVVTTLNAIASTLIFFGHRPPPALQRVLEAPPA